MWLQRFEVNLSLTKFTTENTAKRFVGLYQSIGFVLNQCQTGFGGLGDNGKLQRNAGSYIKIDRDLLDQLRRGKMGARRGLHRNIRPTPSDWKRVEQGRWSKRQPFTILKLEHLQKRVTDLVV